MKNKISRIVKRALDISCAIIFLILFSPILGFICLLLFIIEGRPIFYNSERYISCEKKVKIFKFRTMRVDALDPKYDLEARFMKDGYLDIPLECEVYTPLGRILERLQIVEALQFINIIFNGMSLIGNRPLPKKNIEMLKKFNGWEGRFDSPAGITGISQVVGKLNLKACDRIELECLYSKSYLNGKILMVDLMIVFYTIVFIFFGKSLNVEDARKLLLRSLM